MDIHKVVLPPLQKPWRDWLAIPPQLTFGVSHICRNHNQEILSHGDLETDPSGFSKPWVVPTKSLAGTGVLTGPGEHASQMEAVECQSHVKDLGEMAWIFSRKH